MKLQQITDMLGFTKSRQQYSAQAEQYIPPENVQNTLGNKEIYLKWEAVSRPIQKYFDQKMIKTFMIIGIVLAFVFAILQEFFLIFVIASAVFVTYALSKTPPEIVKYEINSHGVSLDDQMFYWPEFKRFFFTHDDGHHNLALDLTSGMPPRMYLTIMPADQDKIKEILSQKMHYLENPPESFLDKAYKTFASKLNS